MPSADPAVVFPYGRGQVSLSDPKHSDSKGWPRSPDLGHHIAMLEEHVVAAIAIASFSLGLFGAALCLMQDRDVWPYRALALVLLVSSVMDLDTIDLPVADALLADRFAAVTAVLWLVGLTSIIPLFWHYVVAVTSVTPRLPKPLWPHLLLPLTAIMIGIATLFMQRDDWRGLFLDTAPLPSGWALSVGIAGEGLVIASVIQWAVYVVAVTRALRRYRARLHGYVATTAQRELGWVWAVTCGFATYWVFAAFDLIFDLSDRGYDIPEWFESAYGLAIPRMTRNTRTLRSPQIWLTGWNASCAGPCAGTACIRIPTCRFGRCPNISAPRQIMYPKR